MRKQYLTLCFLLILCGISPIVLLQAQENTEYIEPIPEPDVNLPSDAVHEAINQDQAETSNTQDAALAEEAQPEAVVPVIEAKPVEVNAPAVPPSKNEAIAEIVKPAPVLMNSPSVPVELANTPELSEPNEAIQKIESEPVEEATVIEDHGATAGRGTILDTLELRDMDINDVLKLLAAKSGLNIIAGKTIAGRVTIFLQNVDVRDALTIILKANDLAYVENLGIIQVITGAEYEQMFGRKFGIQSVSEVIRLQSIKAIDAVALLNQVKSSTGKIIADDQSNSLIIEEVPQRMAILRNYIKTIDVKTETRVYKIQFVPAEALTTKIAEMVSPKMGSAKFDVASNKIFVRDTLRKLKEIDSFVKQIDVPRETKVFQISYSKAEDIHKTVTSLLTKDIGNAQFDARTNTVMITDIAPKIAEITQVIRAMDKQQRQVFIEARIVQIDLSDKYNMGIDWTAIIPNETHPIVTLSNNLKQAEQGVEFASSHIATVGTLGRETYNAVLNTIATLGNTKTLSSPRVAVVNNQEAKILIGSEIPYVTTTTTQGSSTSTTAEAVEKVKVGIQLVVTPTIHDDGYITMKIVPEVSSADTSIKTGENNVIPIKQTSQVDTTIRVKDGVTIMIGGLMKDVAKNNKSKIPVLGDIPLLGKAFRSEERQTEKTEIVIFLTPHLISGDVQFDEKSYPLNTLSTNKTYFNPLPQDTQTDPIKTIKK